MNFAEVLRQFGRAVEAGDGAALAALFTADGVYDDVFYGEFRGRAAIADMLENRFHRDGEAFRWDFRDPVCDGTTGYAGWLFSYTAKTPHAAGTRVVFDGVGRFRLADGLVAHYADFCNGVVPLRQMGAPWDVVDRMTGRWQAKLEADPDFGAHSGR
jgi:ketosteroid isomerase-like protein